MKVVVTGAAGHVSKPLAELLLEQGYGVTISGRKVENLKGLVSQGASAAIGVMTDAAFLAETFKGADGVYLMLPPNWNSHDIKQTSVDLAVDNTDANCSIAPVGDVTATISIARLIRPSFHTGNTHAPAFYPHHAGQRHPA